MSDLNSVALRLSQQGYSAEDIEEFPTEIERLQARVEKLEEYLDDAANSFQSLLRDHEKIMYLNHITDKQIDAAWKHGEKVPYSVITLSKLNIHRCESPGCDHGMYTEGNDDGSDTMTRACEICNGGGWVKK